MRFHEIHINLIKTTSKPVFQIQLYYWEEILYNNCGTMKKSES